MRLSCAVLAPADGARRAAGPDGPRAVHASRRSIRSVLGTVDLQEPNAAGGGAHRRRRRRPPLQIRGSIYYPANRATALAGDHPRARQPRAAATPARRRTAPRSSATTAATPTWARTSRPGATRSSSLDQDQLMLLPGRHRGQGHAPAPAADRRGARRALRRQPGAAARTAPTPTIGGALVGKLDFDAHRPDGPLARRRRGHQLHRLQPHAPGARPQVPPARRDLARAGRLRAPRALRRAVHDDPAATATATSPTCRARASSSAASTSTPGDPFPRIQMSLLGANHNWFNSVWFADGDDADRHRRRLRHQPAEQHPAQRAATYVRRATRGSGRPGADGRPGEGRPGDDVLVLPALRRRRRRLRPVHDRRAQRRTASTPQMPASACPTSRRPARASPASTG